MRWGGTFIHWTFNVLFSIIRFFLFYVVLISTAFAQGTNVDLLGQFITRGNAVSVSVEGNYAYIADAYSAGIDSLLVVDVSDAAAADEVVDVSDAVAVEDVVDEPAAEQADETGPDALSVADQTNGDGGSPEETN